MDPIGPLTPAPALGAGSLKSTEPKDPKDPKDKDTRQLRQTAQELEGVFLGLLLKSMRGTVSQGGLFGKGTDSEMYQDMFDQEIGRTLARRGGIGLADMIVRDQVLRKAHESKGKPQTPNPAPEVP